MSPRIQQLLDRDGGRCVWCASEPWPQDLTVEHVLPRSRGGRSEPDNLLLACKRCNHARRSKSAIAYARELQAQGRRPMFDLLEAAFTRLSQSPHRAQRQYGQTQLRQLLRLQAAR